jgi:tetratricopeptide (TPR) repeat protein
MIPGETEWVIVFSHDSRSWGSYWYDPKEDALRVTVKPAKSEYHEWLTYEFPVREPEKATVALMWEELQVPIRITVPNAKELWVASLRSQLRAGLGFAWSNLQQAADWCLQNKVNLPEALAWAEKAMTPAVGGSETFSTLSTLWRAQLANGKDADAAKTLEKALANPTANPIAIHYLGRQLQAEGKKDDAVRVFQMNAKRYPGQWPVNVGLMRAYAMTGDKKRALEYAKLAAAQAPDPQNKTNLENMVKLLAEGKEIN